jgi:hypothetical protein
MGFLKDRTRTTRGRYIDTATHTDQDFPIQRFRLSKQARHNVHSHVKLSCLYSRRIIHSTITVHTIPITFTLPSRYSFSPLVFKCLIYCCVPGSPCFLIPTALPPALVVSFTALPAAMKSSATTSILIHFSIPHQPQHLEISHIPFVVSPAPLVNPVTVSPTPFPSPATALPVVSVTPLKPLPTVSVAVPSVLPIVLC